jgi:hypothetical protein
MTVDLFWYDFTVPTIRYWTKYRWTYIKVSFKVMLKTAAAETNRQHVPQKHVEVQVDALLILETVLTAT